MDRIKRITFKDYFISKSSFSNTSNMVLRLGTLQIGMFIFQIDSNNILILWILSVLPIFTIDFHWAQFVRIFFYIRNGAFLKEIWKVFIYTYLSYLYNNIEFNDNNWVRCISCVFKKFGNHNRENGMCLSNQIHLLRWWHAEFWKRYKWKLKYFMDFQQSV